MKKIYPETLLLFTILVVTNVSFAANYYFNVPNSQTFQQVTASQYANCNTSSNSCMFFLGSDGANIHPNAVMTFANNESCMNCTFFSFYDNSDQIKIASNVTFQNVNVVGVYIVIADGASLTLASDLSLRTHNEEPNKMISNIFIGDSSAPSKPSTINLNGHNINFYSPLPPVANTSPNVSVITLSEANSSIVDNSAQYNGQINYYYSPIPVNGNYTYLFSRSLFSANGGEGTNQGTSPLPYYDTGNGHFKLTGPSVSQVVLTDASGNPQSAVFVATAPSPVILTDFDANMQTDGTVHLNWVTQAEENAGYFDVLRSANGAEWSMLATVQANGSTSGTSDYSYIDQQPVLGSNSYRLRIASTDGTFMYSAIKVINNSSVQSLTVFPNPTKDFINVYMGSAITSELTMRLVNISGQLLKTQKIAAGSNIVSIPVNNFSSGVYVLQFTDQSGSSKTIKILIAR
ncbi:MAG: T9SS type A sorting domain-containing protein [Bacteroidetes bacterium]|nr:T9SS type A sorting domain-containing protein [Bacteroidota bacterium]